MATIETEAGPVEILEWGDGDELVLLLHASSMGPGALGSLGRRLVS